MRKWVSLCTLEHRQAGVRNPVPCRYESVWLAGGGLSVEEGTSQRREDGREEMSNIEQDTRDKTESIYYGDNISRAYLYNVRGEEIFGTFSTGIIFRPGDACPLERD